MATESIFCCFSAKGCRNSVDRPENRRSHFSDVGAALSAASATLTGALTAAGDVSAGSLTTTGALNAASITTTGRVTADFLLANNGLSMNNSRVSGIASAIRMWNNTDWGIYMGTSAAPALHSMDGTAAVAYGDVTTYAIRQRCSSSATSGFIFEDGANRGLLSVSGLNGNAHWQLRGTLSVGGAITAPSLATTGNVVIGGKCTVTVTGDLMSAGQAVPTTHPISYQFSVTAATGKYTIGNTFVAKGTSTCIQYNWS